MGDQRRGRAFPFGPGHADGGEIDAFGKPQVQQRGDLDAVAAGALDLRAIEADAGRFDDHVDVAEGAGDLLGPKGARDAVEPGRRSRVLGIVEQQ